MGGSSGGGIPIGDFRRLEEKAKEKLREASEGSRNVFISFSYEDVDEVNLLRGQAKNEKLDLEFNDHSVKEAFDSENAEYIRRQISEKLDKVSVTAVYLSESSASSKWVNWEIEESLRKNKGVIGVYKGDSPPANLPSAFTKHGLKCVKWSHDQLPQAIEDASRKR